MDIQIDLIIILDKKSIIFNRKGSSKVKVLLGIRKNTVFRVTRLL